MKRPAYLRLTGRSERVAVAGTVGSPATPSPWPTYRGALAGLCTVAALLLALALAMAASGLRSEAEAQTSGTTKYTVTDLGSLGESFDISVQGVNEAGQVVGASTSAGGDSHAFVYENNGMVDLGTLPGGDWSEALDINEAGQVVGRANSADSLSRAVIWEKDSQTGNWGITDLGTLLDGTGNSETPYAEGIAFAINDSGQVVGWSDASPDGTSQLWHHAVLWERASGQWTKTDLGLLAPDGSPGDSEAYAINEAGQVVGESDREDFNGTHAFLWNNGGPMQDLGTLNGRTNSVAYDINDSSQVVGDSSGNSFLWQNGTMSPLGDIDPAAINNDEQVVGEMFVEDPDCYEEVCGGNVASIHENGQTKNLNDLIDPTLGWTLDEATDINDKGQIVGMGTINDEYHAFLLTPDPSVPPPDATDPTVEITTPADGATYTLGEDVKADYTCADEEDGSGLASCVGPVASGQSIDTSTLGPKTFEVVATDNEGNTATVTNSYEVVAPPSDVTPPAITITTPEDDAEYKLGQVVAADYSCSDEGSGVASCVGSVPDGANLDTASVGPKTLTVDAADVDGNTASASHDYSVVYDFGNGSGGGFLAPVDNFPTLNAMKAGATVPVKFALGGDQGLDIFAEGYPVSRRISCDTQLPIDPVEKLVAASNSGLKYDAATGHYVYNWTTNKGWAGTCRQLVIKLKDGTKHPLNFRFK